MASQDWSTSQTSSSISSSTSSAVYGVNRPSFSYMNMNVSSENSPQSSSLSPAVHSSSSNLQPPIPRQSSPSFSYNITQPNSHIGTEANLSAPCVTPSLQVSQAISRAPMVSNTPGIPQSYTPYPSIGAAQGPWLQIPPVRSPYTPYPARPFPMVGPRPSVSWPDTQPPGVTPMRPPIGTSSSSVGPTGQMTIDSDLAPGNDNKKQTSLITEQVNAWTAHRSETGVIYYYNALTSESTYEKPVNFKAEPNNLTAQPTPISWEKLTGTDWSLVTTNDGKRYYYNTRTKLSSWQIPTEVVEIKGQVSNCDGLKAQSIPVDEKAPAIVTGGREAIALRPSSNVGPTSSALDLIKKKLQDATSPGPTLVESDINVSSENIKDNNVSESSSDSDDENKGPTTEECISQFKEMLKERGVAPFSKWEKELPKIVFDTRFKAIKSHSARRALFERYVRTRAEEERKEKRAALKAAVEGFKKLLDEAKEDINHTMDYQTFKKKWGNDPRFEVLDRKEKENLFNERVIPLKRAFEEKANAEKSAAISSFKSMLQEQGDITSNSRWSKVKDNLRDDPRYKCVKYEERESVFNSYISQLKANEDEIERLSKAKLDKEYKLKERERALRKRKEREEQEVERVRLKALRKEAIESYQSLLVETIKDPQASWTESKLKLEKDPQKRTANPQLDQSDLEKLFREHVKTLLERCAQEYKALLAKVITIEAADQEIEGDKTVVTSWSTAKRVLRDDPRYTRMPRKDRESLWVRHVEDILRKQNKVVHDQGAIENDSGRYLKRLRTEERR